MAKVIGRHHHLHSQFIHFSLVGHQACVIDQDVHMSESLLDALSKRFHGFAFGKVERNGPDTSL